MSLISQTNLYTTPGTYTYVIPQGVSALEFFLWGAGGANGSAGEVVSQQTGTRIVGQQQIGTEVVGSVVIQAGVAAGQVTVAKDVVVPPGVTAVTVTAVGGGGGGGGSDGGDKNHNIYGLGGAAGELVKTTVAVVPGQVISATVGSGGSGGGVSASGSAGSATVVAINGATVVAADGGGGGAGRAVKAVSPGQNTAVGAGSGGTGSDRGYRDGGSDGSSGTVIVEWSAVPEVRQAISAPVYAPVYEPVFTSVGGGIGGIGGAGGYANRKVRVTQGDVIVVSVGGAGAQYAGGVSLTTPINFSGGSAGISSGSGRGGGGGGATVVTVNGIVVAVAAGGGGGGGGGTFGIVGASGTGAGISGGSGGLSTGSDSATGPSTGGGGGGGYFGGSSGTSGSNGGGGQGGISYGAVIQAGTTVPGGISIPGYPSNRPGYPEKNGAAILTFTKSFNINVKNSNNWKSVDRAWVKVGGAWKELLNGWTKVGGTWAPLITGRSIEGAENLAAPTVTYTLTPDVSSVDEGDTVTFTLGGTGLTNGTVVPYTATGIDADALTSGALSGNFVVGTTDSIIFVPKLNQITYGARTLKVFLDNKGVSATCIVNNISLSPVYTLTPDTPFVNEGGTVIFTLSTANVTAGEIISYSVSGVNASDLSSGALTGQFVVGTSDTASFTLNSDFLTEGLELLTITLHGRPSSASCQIIDTSQTVPSGSRTFSTGGTFVVPTGVTTLNIVATGGGGGGGGADGGANSGYPGGGYPGAQVTTTLTVTGGQAYAIGVGYGGAGGAGRAGSAQGGAGGSGVYAGGRGGNAGGNGSSGAGGGGGGASTVQLNNSILVVAGGGAGAGGSGNGNYGIATIGTYNSSTSGADGQNKSGDGGGGGGGGGGYPLGGAGGPTRGGDSGAYSGTTGQSVLAGGSLSTGTNGGAANSGAGGNGSVVISW